MGVKVTCPNGHRLVVKEELVGKRGACPKCNTAFVITAQGPEGGSAQQSPGSAATASATGAARQTQAASTSAGAGSRPQTRQPPPAKSPARPRGGPGSNGSEATAAGLQNAADPLAEDPAMAWYVRHPGGGQYGPAKGELMRQWLVEGRIGGDSMTWREGWPEWRRADEVFPQFAKERPHSPQLKTSAPVPSAPVPSTAAAKPWATVTETTTTQDMPADSPATSPSAVEPLPTRRGRAFRKRRQQTRMVLSIMLVIVVIALGITLAVVLSQT